MSGKNKERETAFTILEAIKDLMACIERGELILTKEDAKEIVELIDRVLEKI
jgi:hypothetical protein